MKARTSFFLSLVALAATGCVANNGDEASMSDALQAINELHEGHVQAALNTDVDAFLETVSDDFRLMPPNDPGAQGKESVRTWFNATFGAFRIASLEFPETEVRIDHDWAIRHYTYDWTLEPREGGESIRDRGNGLYAYHRESDGSWKVVYDIWTSSEPLPGN